MTHTLTITLDADTFDWLNRLAKTEQSTPEAFGESLLRELADPEHVEGDLMERLLLQTVDYFPPVQSLEEHQEQQAEILDYLCDRIAAGFRQQTGQPLSAAEHTALRERLVERSRHVWPSR